MVVSIDYHSLEAIRTIEGEPEERQKLRAGTDGFCVCTWSDGSVYESKASVLFLTLKEKQPNKKPAGAVKRPAAATATVDEKAEEEDSDSEGEETEEEEEEEEDEEEEEEDAEEEEEDEEVEEPPSKKPKESKPEQNLEDLRTHYN